MDRSGMISSPAIRIDEARVTNHLKEMLLALRQLEGLVVKGERWDSLQTIGCRIDAVEIRLNCKDGGPGSSDSWRSRSVEARAG